MPVKFDIFRQFPDGQPVWVKAVDDLEEARREINSLSDETPGHYFVFDARASAVIHSQNCCAN
jgi:hypothetical protein